MSQKELAKSFEQLYEYALWGMCAEGGYVKES